MKKITKICCVMLCFVILFLIYLEYDNYKKIGYKIDVNKYIDEIEILKNNINIIENYKFNDSNDNKLMTTINRCNILYKDILFKEIIDISDIYYIYKNKSSAICSGIDYDIKNSYNIEKIDIYSYTNLYSDKNIDELFKIVLNNEIITTNEFIKMIDYLVGDSIV